MINIKGMDKAKILVALHNSSKHIFYGCESGDPDKLLTYEEAKELLEITRKAQKVLSPDKLCFDFIGTRTLHVWFEGDELYEGHYDYCNGRGVAERAIQEEFARPA